MKNTSITTLIIFAIITLNFSSCKKEETKTLQGKWLLIEQYDIDGNNILVAQPNGAINKTEFTFNECYNDDCKLQIIDSSAYNGQPFALENDVTYSYKYNGKKELSLITNSGTEWYEIDELSEKDLIFHSKDYNKARNVFLRLK